MGGPSMERSWDPLGDPDALEDPAGWVEPSRVMVAPGRDLFGADVGEDLIRAVISVIEATVRHSYLVETSRAKRLLALGNEGLRFPRNLWIGVVVRSEGDVWRVEDLLRCNSPRPWASVGPLEGPLPSLPVEMLCWVRCVLSRGDGQALGWVRDLRDRCVAAGVPFALVDEDGEGSMPELDGRIWDGEPDGL